MSFQIIFTASELGVFDLMRESGELLSSAIVAERLKTSLTGMQMLLEACVGLKVLRLEWKDGKGDPVKRRKQLQLFYKVDMELAVSFSSDSSFSLFIIKYL